MVQLKVSKFTLRETLINLKLEMRALFKALMDLNGK